MTRCRRFGAARCLWPFQCCRQSRFVWSAWRWAACFAAMFCTDFAWALYVASVRTNAAVVASMWAVALFILGAVAVLGYTRDRLLLIPGALGAFAGTFAGIQWNV